MRRHVGVVHAERERGGCHGQRVRGVVRALDLQVAGTPRPVLLPVQRHAQHAVAIEERGVVAAAPRAHVAVQALGRAHRHVREAAPVLAQRAQAAHLGAHDIVRRVEHGHGPRHAGQVRQQLELRVAVRLEAAMPVQVVGRDVQQHGHVRREAHRGRQLVGRHLGHVHVRGARAHRADARVADVADGRGGQAGARQHVRGERADRRLAVRARHGHPAAVGGALAPGELDLAHQLGARMRPPPA